MWNLFSLAAILIRTVPDRSPDPKYFLFPGLGPADRKIQNGRQRKQIPRKDKASNVYLNCISSDRMSRPVYFVKSNPFKI